MLEQLRREGEAVLLLHGHAVGEGDVAHVLDAAADRDVVHAGRDQRRGEVDGLLRRAALTVDRRRRRLDREPSLEPGVAPDVQTLLTELLDTPRDHVLDLRGVDPGPVDQLLVRGGEERRGMRALVVALLLVAAADRGPGRLDDHYLATLEVAVARHAGSASVRSDQWLQMSLPDWLTGESTSPGLLVWQRGAGGDEEPDRHRHAGEQHGRQNHRLQHRHAVRARSLVAQALLPGRQVLAGKPARPSDADIEAVEPSEDPRHRADRQNDAGEDHEVGA